MSISFNAYAKQTGKIVDFRNHWEIVEGPTFSNHNAHALLDALGVTRTLEAKDGIKTEDLKTRLLYFLRCREHGNSPDTITAYTGGKGAAVIENSPGMDSTILRAQELFRFIASLPEQFHTIGIF